MKKFIEPKKVFVNSLNEVVDLKISVRLHNRLLEYFGSKIISISQLSEISIYKLKMQRGVGKKLLQEFISLANDLQIELKD